MADFTALKTAIQTYIKQNGNEEITGNILQEVLLAMVQTMGDGAINDLVTALSNEVTERQNADGTLQNNINAEALARGNADTALGGRIDGVVASITAINTKLAEGYIYAGIATPSTNPNTPTGKVFYFATEEGTYSNFGSLDVTAGINIIKYDGESWSNDVIISIDGVVTPNSSNLISSSAVYNGLKEKEEELSIEFLDIISNNEFYKTTLWIPGRCVVTDNGDGSCNVVHTGGSQSECFIGWRSKLDGHFVSGHLYFVYAEVYSDTTFRTRFYVGNGFTDYNICDKGIWYPIFATYNPTENVELDVLFERLYYNPLGDTFKIRKFECIDLSEALGVSTLSGLNKNIIANYIRKNIHYDIGAVSKNLDAFHFLDKRTSVLIAANDSVDKDIADFVCCGKDDQILINSVIQDANIKKIVFAKGTYNISSPINLKSHLRISSNGARFENNLDTVYNAEVGGAFSPGETNLVCKPQSVQNFLPGMYVEVVSSYDNSVWGAFLIGSINYSSGRLYIDSNQLPSTKGLVDTFPADSIVRNVSSCFSGYNVTDVSIEGIEIYWNYPSNDRSHDTFWAQNGIHLCNCSDVTIKDCNILNGGRHGILTYYSTNVRIVRCNCEGWGEHGIDLYDTQYESPRIINNIVDGCTCKGNYYAGIQAHSGSRCRIVNNYCYQNRYGISNLQTDNNIIANNVCEANDIDGIFIDASSHSIVIEGNLLIASGKNGIETDRYSFNILISANIIKDCGWYGVFCTRPNRIQINGNKFQKSVLPSIRIDYGKKVLISDNMFDSENPYTCVQEDVNSDYTICNNNVIISPEIAPSLQGAHSVSNNNSIL